MGIDFILPVSILYCEVIINIIKYNLFSKYL